MSGWKRRIHFVCAALLGTGCAPDISSTSATDEESGTTEDVDESSSSTDTPTTGEVSESGPTPICTPGEVQCAGENALQTCDADGLGFTDEPCSSGQVCLPCEDDTCDADRCVGPCDPPALERSSIGCSFLAARQLGLSEVLGPELGVPDEEWPADGLLVVNPSDELTATVQLHDLAQGSTEPAPLGDPLVLGPGGAELVPLTRPLPLGGISTLRIGAMVWVESDAPVAVYSYSPYDPFVGNDSSMLLPETSLARHYVVPAFPPHYAQFQGAGYPTYFDVLATTDDTRVRWLAQFAPTLGTGFPIEPVPAGEWSKEYTVGRFEGMRITASFENLENPHDSDVSGMVVEATAPIYVIGGSRCSSVPASDSPAAGCDPLTEALIPIEQWGRTYVVPHPPLRADEEHYYRIYGADEGIAVTTSPPSILGGDVVFTSRGDYVDVVVPNGTSFVVEADGPVMVVGYLAVRDIAGEIGDPAMYQHVPVEQAATRYALGAPAKWDQQYVQITRESADDVNLDGTPLSAWTPVGSYETTTISVTPGVHILDSASPFTAIQFAYNNSPGMVCETFDASLCHSSYAHPVGGRSAPLYEL